MEKQVIRLLDGEITLYKHVGGPQSNWYCRFKDYSGLRRYVKQSLGTANEDLARDKAMDLFNEARARHSIGAPAGKTTFAYIFKRFLPELSGSTEWYAGKWNHRYWEAWFRKNVPDIWKIDNNDLIVYFQYRRDFWKGATKPSWTPEAKGGLNSITNHPSLATLQKEARVLNWFLKRAFETRLTANRIRCPGTPKLRAICDKKELPENKRRARFNELEYKKFEKFLRERKDKSQINERHVKHRYHHVRVWFFITTIANTGIRPQELRMLQFRDWANPIVDPDGTSFTQIIIPAEKAKATRVGTGKGRKIVSRDFLDTHNRFIEYKREWERYFKRQAKPDDYMFVPAWSPAELARGKTMTPGDMISSVKFALRECDLWETETDGVIHYRTAYSVRAFFLTMRLAEGTPLDILAKHAGTSPEMLMKYYDHSDATDLRDWIVRHQGPLKFRKSQDTTERS